MYEGIGRNVATMAKMKTNLPESYADFKAARTSSFDLLIQLVQCFPLMLRFGPVMATCKHIHLILDLVSCSLAFSSSVVGGIIGFMVIIY